MLKSSDAFATPLSPRRLNNALCRSPRVTVPFSKNNPQKFKIVVVGSGGVGKTSLRSRLHNPDGFDAEMYTAIVGHDSSDIEMTIDGKQIVFTLVDTCGNEGCGKVRSSLYEDAHGAIVMFSYTNTDSRLEIATEYVKDFQYPYVRPQFPVVMVGNKNDARVPERQVSERSAERTYALFGRSSEVTPLGFFRMSVKDGDGVKGPFETLAQHLLQSEA
jgi:small GTP-binding protein